MNQQITLGSLFDGIGVFPLAAQKAGIIPVWASEIEKVPVSITRGHFPEMKHLGDITKLDGREIPPADIITFGSPCQDFTIAGKQDGLAGSRSGLFHEAVRIIREMREHTNGKYPSFAVWENVTGAFVSNHRQDFRAVLESITGTGIPMPRSGRWAKAGLVRGGGVCVSWRTLDARYWGTAQQRRRIFLVADFRVGCTGTVLFKPADLHYNAETRPKGRYRVSGGNRIPAPEAGRGAPTVKILQERKLRHAAVEQNAEKFGRCIRDNGPAPTLLTKKENPAAIWGQDYREGQLRYFTPLECERLMGLPDGWTAQGASGETISDTQRYKGLGNAIALPCAAYVMRNIHEELTGRAAAGVLQ